MPIGELFINKDANGVWQDAYVLWGVSMDETGLSALLAPASVKEYIESESRLNDGKEVDTSIVRWASRQLSLPIHIKAQSREVFLAKYISFCNELKKGKLLIKTKYHTDIYTCVYQSCSQFREYDGLLAKFILRIEETNPAER